MILHVEVEEEEVQKIIQDQLKGGPTIQVAFKAALRYFNRLRACEEACKLVGHKMCVMRDKRNGYWEHISDISMPSEVLKEFEP